MKCKSCLTLQIQVFTPLCPHYVPYRFLLYHVQLTSEQQGFETVGVHLHMDIFSINAEWY